MNKSDFYYELPEELIAQTPVYPRDSARLLICRREGGAYEDKRFYDLPEYLRAGDVLVVNNTRVLPARIFGKREGTGGAVETLLCKRLSNDEWEVLCRPARKASIGSRIVFSDRLRAEVIDVGEDGSRRVRFLFSGIFEEILQDIGEMPLPHYIHSKLTDPERYQTVYAKEEGSSAAPTAGLHFTPELLQKIREMGVEIVEVLLHVGLGTFRPVKTENVLEHKMHSEYYRLSEESAARINAAKSEGRRVIAVGTTSVRVLESCASCDGRVTPGSGDTDIFIYPPYKFKAVDALITNFHLPESTLIMLVSAFIGRENTLALYKHAVEECYRFFSFGDAMLLL